ncbi:glycoside hydrolase family 16 protein [Pseudonocardia xishanensis]|uniref:GH16 domain-containing protein n=1 Tax=Pseudonocardia xishanensis TaxID=630995 RepID=A0ABP8RE77_9PSEU
MSLLSDHLARLVAAGFAALVGVAGHGTVPVEPSVPVVHTAAERPAGGGDRVRRIAAPPRRTPDPSSGENATVTPDTRSPTSGSVTERGRSDRSDGDRGSRASGSRTSGADAPTAAARHGWGTPTREDDFTAGVGDWDLYDGSGHDGNGRRSPDAISVQGGVLTITGTPDGTTGGMAWNPGREYGRWEARVRSPAGDPDYHAVLLLWPDAENWPVGGEVDFMEISDASRQNVEMFLHYGADNSQVQGDVDIDATEWHTWAVEWTPDHLAAFVDGEEWWRTEDTGILPPGPMHLTIQLDNFGGPQQETRMQVDWVREYDV